METKKPKVVYDDTSVVAGTYYRKKEMTYIRKKLEYIFENYWGKSNKEIKEELLDCNEPLYKCEWSFSDAELVPEPDNNFDKNAIKVVAYGVHIGYLKKEISKEIIEYLNNDTRYDYAITCFFNGGDYIQLDDEENIEVTKSDKYWVDVSVTIYDNDNIKEDKNKIVNNKLLEEPFTDKKILASDMNNNEDEIKDSNDLNYVIDSPNILLERNESKKQKHKVPFIISNYFILFCILSVFLGFIKEWFWYFFLMSIPLLISRIIFEIAKKYTKK